MDGVIKYHLIKGGGYACVKCEREGLTPSDVRHTLDCPSDERKWRAMEKQERADRAVDAAYERNHKDGK